MDNEIILNAKDEGSFSGAASKYAYQPELRARVSECLTAAKRSDNRYFLLDGAIVRAAGSTRAHCLHYMQPHYVLLIVQGCGCATHVDGTNGGTMPCGANLAMFGETKPYYCAKCSQ